MGTLWEKFHPYILAVGVVYASLSFRQAQKMEIIYDLANPVLTVLSIIVGFVAVGATFLLAAQEMPIVAKLRSTKAFHRLIGYHWDAVFCGFLAALLAIVLLAARKALPQNYIIAGFHVWVGVSTAAFFACLRVFWMLRTLLEPED